MGNNIYIYMVDRLLTFNEMMRFLNFILIFYYNFNYRQKTALRSFKLYSLTIILL